MISWGSFLLGSLIFGFMGFLFGIIFGGFHEKVRMYEEILNTDNSEDEENESLGIDYADLYSEIDPEQNWRNN